MADSHAVRSDSPAVSYGVGLFETILIANSQPHLVEEHFARLARSCEVLRFPAPSSSLLIEAIESVADAREESAVRCVWVATERDIAAPHSWKLFADSLPIPPVTLSRRARGRAVLLDPSWRRSLPQHKTTSYAVCTLALRQAVEQEADEAIFVDASGGLLEGSATNIFAVQGRTIITPPLSSGILPGVTRRWVLENAIRVGLLAEERRLTRDDVFEGAFLTGSLTTLAPLRSLDGEAITRPGEAFDHLLALFRSTFGAPRAAGESR